MRTTGWSGAVHDPFRTRPALLLVLTSFFVAAGMSSFGDGCFASRWNKQKDINEPTQKAILLHDQQEEDLILQVKYEGPAEDFGWVIPVPGQPSVRKGSMQPFYELSRLTQERFHYSEAPMRNGMPTAGPPEQEIKIFTIKTVGAFEVTVLSSKSASALAEWLAAHQFNFPKEKQTLLDEYVQRHWYFVVARVNPEGDGFVMKSAGARPAGISGATRTKLANGELNPIIINFPSEKCVYPLAISSANGAPCEISLCVIAAQPLASPVVFERKLKGYRKEKENWLAHRGDPRESPAEMQAKSFRDSPVAARMKADDPGDPPPSSVFELPGLGAPEPPVSTDPEDFYGPQLQPLQSTSVEGDAYDLQGCRHDLPRIKGKKWWLTKLVETFPPKEMVDLEFGPAIPFLARGLHGAEGDPVAHCLPQFGALAVSTVLQALKDSDASVRKHALLAAAEIADPQFVDPLLKLLEDKDSQGRKRACYATLNNWNPKFIDPLMRVLRDPDREAADAAQFALREHSSEIKQDAATLRRLLAEDSPASLTAFEVLQKRGELSRADLLHSLSSTNLPVVSSAFTALRGNLQVNEIAPLMTNSLLLARMMALGALVRLGDRPAVDRIVSMLHDRNEAIRWHVRSGLRHLTGQRLGADPATYEKWWAEHRNSYVPQPLARPFGPR